MAEEIMNIQIIMNRKLHILLNSEQEPMVRAELANMRRGIGKKPGELPELWGMLFGDLPENLLGTTREPSRAEWAIYSALTLFALHQQGNSPKTHPMHKEKESLGKAVRRLAPIRETDEFKRIQRKLHIAAVSDDMDELAYRLRGLVQLMRSECIPLDYVQLATDFYWYQMPEQIPAVRLQWGRDFYYLINENDDLGKEEKND